jgi:uncharacterized alpha/beta hydrolase family protein
MTRTFFIIILISTACLSVHANQKIYIIHGFGGSGMEMEKIHRTIDKEGYNSELYTYPSLTQDIDSVGLLLFKKIQADNFDTISFVTHSMGALVVRSLYEHLDSLTKFPFIHRIIMIAPPNNGSPVADYFSQFSFIKFIVGPNVNNLTTNPITGASKYPIPTCEVGIIAGSYGQKKGFNLFIKADNDGMVIPQQTKLGIEKDIVFIRSWHIGLLFNKMAIKQTIAFLKNGEFIK